MGKRKQAKTSHLLEHDDRPNAVKRTRTSPPSFEMSSKVTQLVRKIKESFAQNSHKQNAKAMKKYMRDQFEFLGIKSPTRRSTTRECLNEKLTPPELKELVLLLWELPEREYQYFAIDYLEKHLKTLNDSEFIDNMQFIENLVTSKSWWDTVDNIAGHVVSFLVKSNSGT